MPKDPDETSESSNETASVSRPKMRDPNDPDFAKMLNAVRDMAAIVPFLNRKESDPASVPAPDAPEASSPPTKDNGVQ